MVDYARLPVVQDPTLKKNVGEKETCKIQAGGGLKQYRLPDTLRCLCLRLYTEALPFRVRKKTLAVNQDLNPRRYVDYRVKGEYRVSIRTQNEATDPTFVTFFIEGFAEDAEDDSNPLFDATYIFYQLH
jgi:hypothetical protein